MVVNTEPSSSAGGKAWRYAYSDAGELVGTSDARGCGVNLAYDAAGTNSYDLPDDDAAVVGGQIATLGRMTSVTDRASKTLSHWDMLGRVTDVAKKVASPGGSLGTDQWFHKHVDFDGAGRPTRETTGAGAGDASAVLTSYTARGKVKQVRSTYSDRPLVERIKRNAEGATTEITYGDAANTTTAFVLDDLRRARNVTTYRAKPGIWSTTPTPEELYSHQLLLSDMQFTYDRASNPIEVRDWRVANEWPAGAKPVTRKMQYDDLYRLTRIDYQSPDGPDTWVDPYQAEATADPSMDKPSPSPRADFGTGGHRVMRQTFSYDWKGNLTETDDDAHAFFDRSIGKTQDDGYQLKSATNTSKGGTRTGHLEADYDVTGNLVSLTVHREGTCVPLGKCNDQHFDYAWDEVGRLIEARRWDVLDWQSATHPDAHLQFAYDAGDMRVRKTVVDDASGDERHSLYVFGTLDIRLASHSVDENANGSYEVSTRTEVPYLIANGVRLGRVVHMNEPGATDPSTRVFLELGDHLGSTSIVLDLATGELVQRSTAFAYGGIDSEYRPSRWESFREEYRFTGKEDDVELGLVYFGKRYYAPALGRWISADPLTVHVPGRGDPNAYAYVNGRVLSAVDPHGEVAILMAAAVGAGIAGAINIAQQALQGNAPWNKGFSWTSLGNSMLVGAAAGAGGWLTGYAVGVQPGASTFLQRGAMALGGGSAGGWANGAVNNGKAWDWGAIGRGAVTGAITFGLDEAARALSPTTTPKSDTRTSGERALESAGVGAASAATAWATLKYGLKVDDKYALAGASVALGHGALAGNKGMYNWSNGSGFLACALDSSVNLLGSAGGLLSVAGNADVGLNDADTYRTNRFVLNGGDATGLSTVGTAIGGASNNGPLLDNHETAHVWQQRFFGPLHYVVTAGAFVGGGSAAAGFGLTNGQDYGKSLEAGYYFGSPFERSAYGNQGYYPKGRTVPALLWW